MDQTKTGFSSIDEYIATFPPEKQALLEAMRAAIKAAAPDAQEKIAYQMPTFTLHGNLVHFAAFKNHISFYPGLNDISAFVDDDHIGIEWNDKGTVRFALDRPLPVDIISKIVRVQADKARKEAAAKAGKKKA